MLSSVRPEPADSAAPDPYASAIYDTVPPDTVSVEEIDVSTVINAPSCAGVQIAPCTGNPATGITNQAPRNPPSAVGTIALSPSSVAVLPLTQTKNLPISWTKQYCVFSCPGRDRSAATV